MIWKIALCVVAAVLVVVLACTLGPFILVGLAYLEDKFKPTKE